MDQSKTLSFSKQLKFPDFRHLSHYHTMTIFDALEKKTFENIVGKEENAGNQHFFLLSQ